MFNFLADGALSWDFTLANYDAVWSFMVQLGLLLIFLVIGNILRRTIPLFRKLLVVYLYAQR